MNKIQSDPWKGQYRYTVTNDSGWAYNALGPEAHPLIYATRWITHLCAPTFVLLAGVSIRLQSLGGLSPLALSSRILTRGLWLVFLEVTIIRWTGWSFCLDSGGRRVVPDHRRDDTGQVKASVIAFLP